MLTNPSKARQTLSDDGSEDPEAFDRILDHMKKKNGENADGTPKPKSENQEASEGNPQKRMGEGEASENPPEQDGDSSDVEQGEGGTEGAGDKPEGESEEEGADGEDSGESTGEKDAGEEKEDDGSEGKSQDGQDGETGENKTGEGQTGEGEAGEDQTGEGQEAAGEEGESQAGKGEGQTGESAGESAGEKGEGEEGSTAGESGSGGDQEGEPTDEPGEGGGAEGAGDGSKTGDGVGNDNTGEVDDNELGGDDPNLEYTRKATDLVLEYLRDQENKQDKELLERLGWTPEQMRKFSNRWNKLHREARRGGNEGQEGQRELQDALRSLGLHPGRDRIRRGTSRDDKNSKVRDTGTRSLPPDEYLEQYRAYLEGKGLRGN